MGLLTSLLCQGLGAEYRLVQIRISPLGEPALGAAVPAYFHRHVGEIFGLQPLKHLFSCRQAGSPNRRFR